MTLFLASFRLRLFLFGQRDGHRVALRVRRLLDDPPVQLQGREQIALSKGCFV